MFAFMQISEWSPCSIRCYSTVNVSITLHCFTNQSRCYSNRTPRLLLSQLREIRLPRSASTWTHVLRKTCEKCCGTLHYNIDQPWEKLGYWCRKLLYRIIEERWQTGQIMRSAVIERNDFRLQGTRNWSSVAPSTSSTLLVQTGCPEKHVVMGRDGKKTTICPYARQLYSTSKLIKTCQSFPDTNILTPRVAHTWYRMQGA